MNTSNTYILIVMVAVCWLCCLQVQAGKHHHMPAIVTDTVPQGADTLPSKSLFPKMAAYRDSLFQKKYRDSLLRKITRQNAAEPKEDSTIIKSEKRFLPASGKVIRNIYFKRIAVFGPKDINDTTFFTRNNSSNWPTACTTIRGNG